MHFYNSLMNCCAEVVDFTFQIDFYWVFLSFLTELFVCICNCNCMIVCMSVCPCLCICVAVIRKTAFLPLQTCRSGFGLCLYTATATSIAFAIAIVLFSSILAAIQTQINKTFCVRFTAFCTISLHPSWLLLFTLWNVFRWYFSPYTRFYFISVFYSIFGTFILFFFLSPSLAFLSLSLSMCIYFGAILLWNRTQT